MEELVAEVVVRIARERAFVEDDRAPACVGELDVRVRLFAARRLYELDRGWEGQRDAERVDLRADPRDGLRDRRRFLGAELADLVRDVLEEARFVDGSLFVIVWPFSLFWW